MIISAQNNAPVMGCVQNTLICMYLLTETFVTPEDPRATGFVQKPSKFYGEEKIPLYETFVEKEDFMASLEAAGIGSERFRDLLFRAKKYYPKYIKQEGDSLKLASKVPGKILASIVFPRTFTWERKTDVNDRFPVTLIKNGIILPESGPIQKKTIGGTAGSSVHALWKISPDTASRMISECQFISSIMISRVGFSMGVSDSLPTKTDAVKAAISKAKIECDMINASEKEDIDKEREINGSLNEAMGIAPLLAKTSMNKGDRNALVIMERSGAKGSVANNGQISAFVGQQNIDGKRAPRTVKNGKSTLPHFLEGDNSPDARGFVDKSYLQGITFTQAWFHAGAGRRGVIDTAMKSVTFETLITIDCDKFGLRDVKIGEWIDDLFSKTSGVKILDRNMELLRLSYPVYIPTCDLHGKVSWGKITDVTRHDPTNFLYKINTEAGKTVTVTDSKSLLIWKEYKKQFEQTFMKNVKIGDFMPSILWISKNWAFCQTEVNDVQLDKIVSIEKLDGKHHKYVYDLTVPSTTNFGLSNGLVVVDTADKPLPARAW